MSNIVLVHGAFVDGSGWQAVYRLLRGQGYNVSVVQHSTATLADDVRAVRQVLAAQDGPSVLVGHSYGGAIITEAGTDGAWRRCRPPSASRPGNPNRAGTSWPRTTI